MRKLLFFLLLLAAQQSFGQAWSGLLSSNRAVDWSSAGAGTIPTRTTICQTLGASGQTRSYAQSVTAAQINTALSACASTGTTVFLNPGTYSLTATILAQSGVTLRGGGPSQVALNFSGTLTNFVGLGYVAVGIGNGDSHMIYNTSNVMTVTSGMTKGSTSVVLGSTAGSICGSAGTSACSGALSNLKVGSIVIFNQQDDASDTGNAYFCGTAGGCSQQSDSGTVFTGRAESQGVVVTACGTSTPGATCTSSTITFTPALYAPNWSMSKNPVAAYSSTLPITGFGLEGVSIDTTAATATPSQPAAIETAWADGVWVKNVAVTNNSAAGSSFWAHLWTTSSVHVTIQDSYLYGASPTLGGYGVLFWQTYDSLAQNNICQHMPTCTLQDSGTGNVFAYNYAVDNYYTGADACGTGGTQPCSPHWQQCDQFHHNAGDYYNLWEGSIGICRTDDSIHGTQFADTVYRNALSGFDPVTTPYNKTQNILTINDMAFERYNNYVGNVLGYGVTNAAGTLYYQYVMASAGDCGPGSPPLSNSPVWVFDDSGQTVQAANSGCGSTYNVNNDVLANARPSQSAMRWCNWDPINGVRCSSGETASSASTYPGLSSPTSALPVSLYLPSGAPNWWHFTGTTQPFPAIGPDRTGGNISGTSGYAGLNPAADYYLNGLSGTTSGSTGNLSASFDGTVYYAGSSPQMATPTITPNGATFTGTQSVTLADSTPNSTIYYTTDGTTPTTSSTVYSSAITLSATTTVKAVAQAPGYTLSNVASATFTLSTPTCGTPWQSGTLSGTYNVPPNTLPINVQFANGDSCTLHCTTDGSTPTSASPVFPTGGWNITATGTYVYRCGGFQAGWNGSVIWGGTWTVLQGFLGSELTSGVSLSPGTQIQ